MNPKDLIFIGSSTYKKPYTSNKFKIPITEEQREEIIKDFKSFYSTLPEDAEFVIDPITIEVKQYIK